MQVQNLSGVSAIAAGGVHSLALKNDGTVWAWGYNRFGQLGNGTNTDSITPVQVSNLTGVTAVAGGDNRSLAVVPNIITATATTADGKTYNSGDWTNQDVTLTLSADDGQSGSDVDNIYYSTDGGDTYTTVDGSSATVNVTNEGQTKVYYYATDKAGNKETEQTFTVNIDKSAPTNPITKPKDRETGVWRGTNITAIFSEPMDPDLLKISIKLYKGASSTPVKATVTVSSDSKTITLDPKDRLAAGTRYRVKIIGAKDLAGNTLPNYTWRFKTRG